MSIFTQIKFEESVQLYDKTRISAVMSFQSKGDNEINEITIKPDESTTAVSVFEAGNENWFLDWAHQDLKYDITSDNNLFYFKESSDLTATLHVGSYRIAELLDELEEQLNVASSGYTVSQGSDGRVTITGSTAFEIQESEIQKALMLATDVSSTSQVSNYPVEYAIKAITVECGNGENSDSKTVYQKVYSERGDYLFCNDSDLLAHESDIYKYIPEGRSSHKNVYRQAQSLIVEFLDRNGYVNAFGQKYYKKDIVDISEVREWAKFMSLRLIFENQSNAVDDIFSAKVKKYESFEIEARNRLILRLDTNRDGKVDINEGVDPSSGSMYRR